jgi:outer membrane immunogenic protein
MIHGGDSEMRLRLIGLVAATVALGSIQNSFAEEQLFKAPPRKAPVYKAPVYKAPRPVIVVSPTGFYVGGHIGGGWTYNSFADPLGAIALSSFRAHDSGFLGGVQLGYNWQTSNYVLGIQGDITFTDLNAATPAPLVPTMTVSNDTKWVSTLTGRVGYALDKTLWYVKGGGAWVRDHYGATDFTSPPVVAFGASTTRAGYVVGGGLEYALAPNWSAFLEYNYIELTSKTIMLFDPITATARPADVYQNIQMVKAGFNYKLSAPGVW